MSIQYSDGKIFSSTSVTKHPIRVLWLLPLLVSGSLAPVLPVPAKAFPLRQNNRQQADQGSSAKLRKTIGESGKPIERELSGGTKHTYPFTLKTNDYLKLVVEQKGIDVVVRLLGPGGKPVQEVDSPNGAQGPEPLAYIVDQAGSYLLEVEALEKTVPPGAYELKLEPVKPATEQDRAEIEIPKLNAQVINLRRAGKYDQGLVLAQQAVEQSEKKLGSEHLLLAESLNLLALLFWTKGDSTQAEPLYQRAVGIREKALGPDHVLVAQSLNNLAQLYADKGDSNRAEQLLLRALAIREKNLPPEHPEIANSLNNLAVFYKNKGDYVRAEPLYQQALALWEKILGPDHPDVATALNNLALLYRSKGDSVQAEPLLLRSLVIREKKLGPDHSFVAQSLANLADLYREKGNYIQAEPLLRRSLAIREKALGPDHLEVANSLNHLALLLKDKGDYTQAEPLSQRALAIREKALGPDHPEVANSLNNLALIFKDKGDYEKAEPLFLRSLTIWEKARGPKHPDVANSLNSLAVLYKAKGDYAQAESFNQRALAIRESTMGPDHRVVAETLNNLAVLYLAKSDYVRAEPLLLRALTIWEKTLGPNHPVLALCLNNLATLYRDKGDSNRAEPLYRQSLAIFEKALGPDHPNVSTSLNNLAALYQDKGDLGPGIQFQIRCNDSSERDLRRNLISGSETQKVLYLKQTGAYTDRTISLHLQLAPLSVEAKQAALTEVLRRKGRALDAMTNALAALRNQTDAGTQKLLDDYTKLVGQISIQTLRGPGRKQPEEHLASLKSLNQEKEKLENEISRRSEAFQVQNTPVTVEAIQKLIPPDAVLVEYAVYRPVDAKTHRFEPPHYAVYVLNRQGDIRFADLGAAGPIDQAVTVLRTALASSKTSLKGKVTPAAQALEKLVMQPVRPLVGKTSHLLLSPDASLNLIPFAALQDERGKYLVEQFTLSYLTSGRDLLRLQVKIPSQEPALVLADPDFREGKGPLLAGKQFAPLARLAGTTQEGTAVQHLLDGARLKMQSEASVQTLKAVHRPHLLHLATHGYFLEDVPRKAADSETRMLIPGEEAAENLDQLRVENPLLRSWLFFAGANQEGSAAGNGTMTALEAAQLDLWGTQLVTLSACETGVGEAKTGDGVYGLRRALVLAGSEAQLMSLWSVSDQGTRELMVNYYTRLKNGEGRSEALRHVQLDLLQNPKRKHPYYWASFIQSGAWTSLEGKP